MARRRGFSPLADAHGKQRVSAVLSSVDTSDLHNLTVVCLPSNPLFSCQKKTPVTGKNLLRGFGAEKRI